MNTRILLRVQRISTQPRIASFQRCLSTTPSLHASSSPSPTATPQSKSTVKADHKTSENPSGDYGSGTGDPRGETPLQQGTSTATSDLEHPGPSPPSVGHGSGSATKAGKEGHYGEVKK